MVLLNNANFMKLFMPTNPDTPPVVTSDNKADACQQNSVFQHNGNNLSGASTDNKTKQLDRSDVKYSQNACGNSGAGVSTIPKNQIPYLEIKKITDLNTGIYKDQVIQMPDGKFYEFDSQGRVERIYNEPKKTSVNGTENSYIFIDYNDDNTVAKYYKFENEGKIIDGKRYCGIYNMNGELESYYLESDFDPVSGDCGVYEEYDTNGNLTEKFVTTYDANGREVLARKYDKAGNLTNKAVTTYDANGRVSRYNGKTYYPAFAPDVELLHKNMDTITSEILFNILNDIEAREISGIDSNDEFKNNILFVMDAYEAKYGKSLIEALAETPNGKEHAQTLIEHVETLCEPWKTEDNDTVCKYTDDIQGDMASHPTDYKKLSIDLKRMLSRPWLLESGNYGDDIVDINGKIDSQQNVKQNLVGDCYLIASIIELSQKPEGARAIKEMIHENDDGSVTVTFKGVNKSYTIPKQELLDSDNFSVGDDDMRAIEIAFDKYRRDLAYESEDYITAPDAAGGFLTDVTQVIFGKNTEYIQDGKFNIKDFNNQNTAYTFDFGIGGTYDMADMYVKNAVTGELLSDRMIQNHEYAIVKSDENNVYFINPWNKNELLSMSIDEFKNLKGISVSRFEFDANH